jgi:DNA adenine methylase
MYKPAKEPLFPPTKFMGSKQTLLPFIFKSLNRVKYDSVLDAFSGSGCVSYEFKRRGKSVVSNDFLHCSFVTAKALIENNSTKIDDQALRKLMTVRNDAITPSKVADTYSDLFFTKSECQFLDSLWANIQDLSSGYQRNLALAAACRACQKKRPRGIFTVIGKKGWDARKDLKLSLQEQFANAVRIFNNSVFDNGKAHRAVWSDIMNLPDTDFDLVYLDPPYWSPLSDNDYVRRYHFIEGYSRYWEGLDIDMNTKARKFKSYLSPFSQLGAARNALSQLFERYSDSTIIVSYSSNGLPSKSELLSMLESVKRKVTVFETDHRYSFANQAHAKQKIKNKVREYVFVAA